MVRTWEQQGKEINEEQDKRVLAEFERRKNENSVSSDAHYLTVSSTAYPTAVASASAPITETTSPKVNPSTVSQDSLRENTIQTHYETSSLSPQISTTKQPEVSTVLSVSMSISKETARTKIQFSQTSTSNAKPPAETLPTAEEPVQDPITFSVAETKSEVANTVKCTLPPVPENIVSVSVTNCFDAAVQLPDFR